MRRTDRLIEMVGGRLAGLAQGLATVPDARGWLESLALALALTALAAPLARAGGLIDLPSRAAGDAWRYLLVPFLAPGLLEECVFRGLLLPHPRGSGLELRLRARWWLGALVIYVASHPLTATLVRPAARDVFDAPVFLLEAALLGVTATALYERTGSLWPAVLLHGAVVAIWLHLGGAALLRG